MRLISREKGWALVCLLVLLNISVSVFVSPRPLLTAYGDVSQCLLLLVVLASFIRNIKASEPRARLFWIFLSLGCGIWLGAQLLWTYFEVILRQDVPNPFVGDVILFLHLVPMMGALAVQPHRERDEQATHVGVLDFLLLLVWWLYLYMFVVIPWQYISPDQANYGRSFNLLYFLEHLVFVIAASKVWDASTGAWRKIYGNLLGASILYAFASIAAGLAIDSDRYYTGSLYDVPLLASMAWFAGTGFIAGRLKPSSDPASEPEVRRSPWISSSAMLTLLSLPALAAWSSLWSIAPLPVRSYRLLLTLLTMLFMGILVWIKQHRLDKEISRVTQGLREDSLTDILTGAKNRRFLSTTIEADVRFAVRSHFPDATCNKRNRDLLFYLVDSDSFKDVNDRYGHDIGDQVLVETARRISSAIRHSDVLIRWGGDEFLVVSRYSDREDAATLASRILANVGSEPFELKGGIRLFRTCSIGWAAFPWFTGDPASVSYREVLGLADCALYDAKKGGRNQAVGMLPVRESPLAPTVAFTGKESRLTEQLVARSITTPGPKVEHAAQDTSASASHYLGA
jgi:diguanylate cyclase (GGDEF)-like protein